MRPNLAIGCFAAIATASSRSAQRIVSKPASRSSVSTKGPEETTVSPPRTATVTASLAGRSRSPPVRAPRASSSETHSSMLSSAGTYSGAGSSLQGLIAATTKQGSGIAKPVAAAIDELIEDGTYAKWLAAYNLSNEAVKTSEVNPEGLPLDNS